MTKLEKSMQDKEIKFPTKVLREATGGACQPFKTNVKIATGRRRESETLYCAKKLSNYFRRKSIPERSCSLSVLPATSDEIRQFPDFQFTPESQSELNAFVSSITSTAKKRTIGSEQQCNGAGLKHQHYRSMVRTIEHEETASFAKKRVRRQK